MNELKHLAIIMDGNRRWAKQKGFIQSKGHEMGANVVEDVVRFCLDKKVETLTLYAFSIENWNRPKQEVKTLLLLLNKFLDTKKELFLKENIKFKPIGDIEELDEKLKEKLYDLQSSTKNNSKLNFNLAINYSAKNEIVRACNKVLQKGLAINEQNISSHLDTAEFGDVDLLVRTGGEQRISNFLLWQSSYAEFEFTPTLWPDFGYEELDRLVKVYEKKSRRFGR
ncbi:polyprenyl diphosphate synthase [uncultured Campylobacter sp.]|uniref:polyprenyl diphosphate synthase n=1 Tax=uncultured Campylobacter sp. TaxID=218934 RepID=UPI00263834FF|nr:polyprenyl diphosphate synthase [uncultured Campylobacter sp.]